MNRKILPGLVGVLLLLLVAAGAFYGGMRFQRMRVSNTRAIFFANRGGAGNADIGDGAVNVGRRSSMGRIESIKGNIITVLSQQEQFMVTVTDATKYQKLVEGKLDDLQVGGNIIVLGERDANGRLTAANIQLAGPVPGLAP